MIKIKEEMEIQQMVVLFIWRVHNADFSARSLGHRPQREEKAAD